MKLILLGPPGSGKGTQGQMICEKFDLVHISTGDILRQAVKNQTQLGLEAKKFMEKGQLVSDDLINQMTKDRLNQDDCQNRFLLDGYPRTLDQAEFLDSQKIDVDFAILINVPDSTIVERIVGRRVHPASGRIYHIKFSPPKEEGIDDMSGEKLVHRSDDYEQTVLSRLNAYHTQTAPLIDFYATKNKLKKINGNQKPNTVFEQISEILGD